MAPFLQPSSYHSSICGLLMPPERRFLCSQCSCINSPKLRGLPALERLAAAQAELLHVVQVARASSVVGLLASASSDPARIDPALREKPVKNSSRLSSRSNSASMLTLQRLARRRARRG